jgi:hypothetical protein
MMRRMMAIMDAMEVAQRRGISQADDNDDEAEVEIAREELEEQVIVEERMIKANQRYWR